MKKYAMMLVRKDDGQVCGIEDYFATKAEVDGFLGMVAGNTASGYTHEARLVERHFYMIPVHIPGVSPTKGYTTLTELDEHTAKCLWLGGRTINIQACSLPEPTLDLARNVQNLLSMCGTVWTRPNVPESELRHTYDEIWESDKKTWLNQHNDQIHFIIAE